MVVYLDHTGRVNDMIAHLLPMHGVCAASLKRIQYCAVDTIVTAKCNEVAYPSQEKGTNRSASLRAGLDLHDSGAAAVAPAPVGKDADCSMSTSAPVPPCCS